MLVKNLALACGSGSEDVTQYNATFSIMISHVKRKDKVIKNKDT